MSSDHQETWDRLRAIFEDVFDRPVELHAGTTAADIEEWDSVAHVVLILATETEFGIRFESSEILNAADVGEFVELVTSKMNQ